MKYALPLFAALSLCVLLWGSCTSTDANKSAGSDTYHTAPSNNDLSDTTSYDPNNSAQDTINAHPDAAEHADTATGIQ